MKIVINIIDGEKIITDDEHIYQPKLICAYKNNIKIGSIELVNYKDYYDLDERIWFQAFRINEDCRRNKVGTQMIDVMKKYAKENNHGLWACVKAGNPKEQQGTVEFYLKNGFKLRKKHFTHWFGDWPDIEWDNV